jgi:hypothetical protein
MITRHVPDNQAQDGPTGLSSGFNDLTGERCDDQLASPTIVGRSLHDENSYMMIAFDVHI